MGFSSLCVILPTKSPNDVLFLFCFHEEKREKIIIKKCTKKMKCKFFYFILFFCTFFLHSPPLFFPSFFHTDTTVVGFPNSLPSPLNRCVFECSWMIFESCPNGYVARPWCVPV